PVDNRQDVSFLKAFTGDSEAILQQMAAAVQGLTIGLDPSGCTGLDVTAAVEGTFDQLAGVRTLGLLALCGPDNPVPVGSVVLRRQDDAKPFAGRVYCRTSDLDSIPVWLVIAAGGAVPAQTRALNPLQLGQVFVRTRTTKSRAEYKDESGGIAFS